LSAGRRRLEIAVIDGDEDAYGRRRWPRSRRVEQVLDEVVETACGVADGGRQRSVSSARSARARGRESPSAACAVALTRRRIAVFSASLRLGLDRLTREPFVPRSAARESSAASATAAAARRSQAAHNNGGDVEH
jgi:hypothetical protein